MGFWTKKIVTTRKKQFCVVCEWVRVWPKNKIHTLCFKFLYTKKDHVRIWVHPVLRFVSLFSFLVRFSRRKKRFFNLTVCMSKFQTTFFCFISKQFVSLLDSSSNQKLKFWFERIRIAFNLFTISAKRKEAVAFNNFNWCLTSFNH